MLISFYSFSSDESIHFEAIANINNNVISFKDKDNNLNEFIIIESDNSIEIKRTGSIESIMNCIVGKKTKCFYNTKEGLEIEFEIETKSLKIEKKKITIEYDLSLDGNILNNYKIWLLIH